MKVDEAREKFIQAWGAFAGEWGINRTMAQVHALLLVAHEPMSADDIMAALLISRGNVNMNVRELIDWGLVRKEYKMGERKEFFTAEKDIWKVAKLIMIQRKKKELEPMVEFLDELAKVEPGENAEKDKAFVDTVKNIRKFATDADRTLDKMVKADEHWFLGTFMRFIRP